MLFTILTVALAASLVPSVESSVPNQVNIGYSFNGTGCPTNSVAGSLSANFETINLLFNSSEASIGPSINANQNIKTCTVEVALAHDQGFQFSVDNVFFGGFADLDSGVKATQQITYNFYGDSETDTLAATLSGPLNSDYRISDTQASEVIEWSPCGSYWIIWIDTEILLTASNNAAGEISVDNIDGWIEFLVGIQWQACT